MTPPLEMVLRKNLIDLKRADTRNEITSAVVTTLFSFLVFSISLIKGRKKKEVMTKRLFSCEGFEVLLIIQQS